MSDRTEVPAGGSSIEQPIERSTARLIVAVALVALGYGTLSGSSPLWPDDTVYAISAFTVAAVWVVSVLEPRRLTSEVADASLLALGLIRGAGYTLDLVRTGQESYWAAIAAWAIVVVVTARPLRHAR